MEPRPNNNRSSMDARVQQQMNEPVEKLGQIALTAQSNEFRNEMVRRLHELITVITEISSGSGEIPPLPIPDHIVNNYASSERTTSNIPLRSAEHTSTSSSPSKTISSSVDKKSNRPKRRSPDTHGDTSRAKKARKSTDSVTLNTSGKKVWTKIAITDTCNTTELQELRQVFTRELIQRSNRPSQDGEEDFQLLPDEVDDIASFFFDEIMGANTLKRLTKLIDAYTGNQGQFGTDAGARVRLSQMATDNSAPMSIRKFCGTFSRQEMVRQSVDPNLQHLQMIINSRELLAEYDRLKEAARKGDPDLIKYLQAQNLTQAVGKGWSSVAIDFLAEVVKIKRSTFKWTCEKAKGLDCLVGEFGEGVLPLLPPGSIDKLRRFGIVRMRIVCEILKQTVSGFQEICDLTCQYIYTPFIEGVDKLPLDSKKLGLQESKSFMKLITEAANN